MTKRDVAVWFCKVVALVGIGNAVFNILSGIIGLSGITGWNYSGTAALLWPVPALAFYGFVYLFARGIGTEIAAEGEHSEPITSSAELGVLLLRCVGLSLFLFTAMIFVSTFFSMAIQYFSTRTTPSYARFMMPERVSQFVECAIGFLLAFGPRLRAAMRSN